MCEYFWKTAAPSQDFVGEIKKSIILRLFAIK